MSDLDDFFAKRLEEEASFPNRAKNWKQMAQRLDAFDTGAVQGPSPRLRTWQIATLVAVAVVGVLLWKTYQVGNENKTLRQDIASIQLEQAALAEQLAEAQKHTLESQNTSGSSNSTPAITNVVALRETKDQVSKKLNPGESLVRMSGSSLKIQKKEPKLPLASTLEVKKIAANEPPSTVVASQKTEHLEMNGSVPLPSLQDTSSASEIAITLQIKDTLNTAQVPKDSAMALIEQSKDSIASTRLLAQDIKPQPKAKDRFRVGAQATIGFVLPKEKGVSSLRGQGFSAEVRLIKSLWVTASIDWLHHEVSTERFVPRFHPPHDSLPEPPNSGGGGGPHPSKLVLVESTPREQHLGFGLRYTLPVKFWAQPSIRVAHEWTHISPTLVTYKFEEENPGGPMHDHDPEYTAEKFEALWLKNQWRFGIGLEKDIPQWTFGLWADYSKDFSASTPSFDALYLRAGAQFRF